MSRQKLDPPTKKLILDSVPSETMHLLTRWAELEFDIGRNCDGGKVLFNRLAQRDQRNVMTEILSKVVEDGFKTTLGEDAFEDTISRYRSGQKALDEALSLRPE